MKILAIESSCDETAVAIVEDGRKVLTDCIASQVALHREYGGVVPEIASRKHIEAISGLAEQALANTGLTRLDIDAVAVTYAPGLIGAVLVGVNFAKAAALALNKPLIPVHHIRGHIAANYLAFPELEPPFLCLIVSGGHTMIVDVKDYTEMEILGTTLDDAAGECFDKVAEQVGEALDVDSLCAGFSAAVSDMLVPRVELALQATGRKKVAIAGGVAANSRIRRDVTAMAERLGVEVFIPPLSLCGDNGAMIGAQGYYEFLAGHTAGMELNAYATKSILGESL